MVLQVSYNEWMFNVVILLAGYYQMHLKIK